MVPVTIPPLRERDSDIPVLARYFIGKLRERTGSEVNEVSREALERLCDYTWPGNVRQLENVIERALVMAEGTVLEPAHLPMLAANGQSRDPMGADSTIPEGGLDLTSVVEGMEERLLRRALDQARGVKAEAARLLGLKASALYYKLEKYGIEA